LSQSIEVDRLREELEALKRLERAAAPVAAPLAVPAPAAAPKEMKKVSGSAESVSLRSSKWDALAAAGNDVVPPERAVPAPTVTKPVVAMEFAPAIKQKPAEPEPKPVAALPVEKPKPKPKPQPAVAVVQQEPAAPAVVEITFPVAYHKETELLFDNEDFTVSVLANIAADDLVTELRRAVATKTRTKFGRVGLKYKGKVALSA
jgi:hypothetical protein